MSQLKLTADSGGGTVAIKGPASTTGNNPFELTVPGTASGNILTSTSGSSIQVLEQFYSVCDGSVIATSAGNLTLPSVTALQNLTTTFQTITGSEISYTPPSGTTQVIYTLQFAMATYDSYGMLHGAFYVDGTEATDAQFTQRNTVNYADGLYTFKWGINIGGSTTAASGRLASWTSAKTLLMKASEYTGSYEVDIHVVRNYAGSTPSQVRKPCIGITAIGVPS